MSRRTTNLVLAEVAAERHAQDTRWGEQNHPDGTGPRVAFAGRLCYMADAARDARRAAEAATGNVPGLGHHGPLTWKHILREEVFEAFAEGDPVKLRAELIQVAAVAVNWIEAIDRRTARECTHGADCQVHPDANQPHNFDAGEVSR